MAVGTGILFIVFGAILRFGITSELEGIDLNVIGVILMVAGAIGALIGLIMATMRPSQPHSHDAAHTHDPAARPHDHVNV